MNRDGVTAGQRGNTTIRDRHRRVIRRGEPPCGICGEDIDYALAYPDLRSFVVDHVIPINRGGDDTLDNKQPAHNTCNRAKSDALASDLAARTYVTHRAW